VSRPIQRWLVWRRTTQPDHGSVAVEFALVLPLVLIMCLALLQVALLAKDQLVVLEAARAGAREGAVSREDGRARHAAIDAASSLRSSDIEVAVSRSSGVGTPVRVTVRYRASAVVPFVGWLFPSVIELHANAVMRQETE
jgi:Flp pilus assembly protein TadG